MCNTPEPWQRDDMPYSTPWLERVPIFPLSGHPRIPLNPCCRKLTDSTTIAKGGTLGARLHRHPHERVVLRLRWRPSGGSEFRRITLQMARTGSIKTLQLKILKMCVVGTVRHVGVPPTEGPDHTKTWLRCPAGGLRFPSLHIAVQGTRPDPNGQSHLI